MKFSEYIPNKMLTNQPGAFLFALKILWLSNHAAGPTVPLRLKMHCVLYLSAPVKASGQWSVKGQSDKLPPLTIIHFD